MLSEDERKSIQLLTKKVDNWNCKRPKNPLIFSGIVDEIDTENNAIRTVLNLITKLQKENKEKDNEINELVRYIDESNYVNSEICQFQHDFKTIKCIGNESCKDCIKSNFKKLAKEKGE